MAHNKVRKYKMGYLVSMTFRVVRANLYNQDLGLIHSTNGNHLESPNEGSSIDHQVTVHLHAQNITMFPTPQLSRRSKEFDKNVQQQVTVAKSMRVNTTVACDWLNFEFQSLRLILVAAGGWWLARTIERIHERVMCGEYCFFMSKPAAGVYFVQLLVVIGAATSFG
ncbi:hypothetical protein F511_40296 [Dorcoceras hygrometricum]|uniref:Uncharacterized protein n=1 Tax=Dorcoceras hygrometricum TaxID=472368 RepID=A0A2Z7AT23_9LAMI|nr:hypothetical protein F511_40296 [Dorcoceras hygrometricum]